MTTLKTYTESCAHGALPPCTHDCPLKVDIKKIMSKITAGNFDSAYREYRKKAVFPLIVSKICKQPCMQECPSKLPMALLEQACVEHTGNHSPEKYNLPKKKKKIAIIGAGLSGLACMQRLSAKCYDVTVFEGEAEIGGHLYDYLSVDEYMPELVEQLSKLEYELVAGKNVDTLNKLNFDAVYIATGAGGEDFGLYEGWNSQTLMTERAGIFLGGGLTGCNKIEALAHGIKAAACIEKWLKVGYIEAEEESHCPIKPKPASPSYDGIINADKLPHDYEAAKEEAKRCQNCDCTICYDTCEFMKEQGLMPREIEVKTINIHGPVTRVSNKMIASCALCGHCKSVCEFDVNIEMVMRQGKQVLFEDGGFPPMYHDYYMRDLDDAMGNAYLCKPAPGKNSAKYLFFPGCQAAGANPQYVTVPYRYMLENNRDTAIMLGCCGVPALYAGDVEKMKAVHKKIVDDIHSLSDPVIVLSCPTCAKMFDEFFPGIKWMALYEYIAQNKMPEGMKQMLGNWALFDPCASRNFTDMQDSVRELLFAADLNFEELPENKSRALCCGQGGHIYAANPQLSKKMTRAAIEQSKLPYMTYCTNCRDIFLASGKQTAYILDLLFGIDRITSPVHILQRHKNRYEAKNVLIEEIWNENVEDISDSDGLYRLCISEELLNKMDHSLISEDEVLETILFSEEQRSYFTDQDTGIHIGHKKNGYITIWVEYKIDGDEIALKNVYSHRITFE